MALVPSAEHSNLSSPADLAHGPRPPQHRWPLGFRERPEGGEAGCMLGCAELGRPFTQGFPPSILGQSGLRYSELAWEFRTSLLGSPWEPQALPAFGARCRRDVPGLGGLPWHAHLERKGSHLFSPFCWICLSPGRSSKAG